MGWKDGVQVVCTSPDYTFTVSEDKTLLAIFSQEK